MNKKNKIIAILTSSIISLSGCTNYKNIQHDIKISTTTQTLEEITNTTQTILTPTETTTISTAPTSTENITYENTTTTPSTSESTTKEESLNEEELISIFEDQESLIMNEAINGTKEELKQKLDEYFTLTIGFLFCNQPIKGKTLDELTTTTKIKITSIASNINDIIELYIPDYKITIKETYTDIKVWTLDKFEVASSSIKESIKQEIGEEKYKEISTTYENAKTKIKDIAGNAWDKTKDLTNKGKEKIKDWWYNKTNNN